MPLDQFIIREVCKYIHYEDRVSLSLTNWQVFRILLAETSRSIVWSLKRNKGLVPRFHRPFKFIDATKAPLFQSPSGSGFLCITHLAFSSCFVSPICPGAIPNMVTHLVLSKDYTESLVHALPPGLRSLAFHTHDSHYARLTFQHEDACVAHRNNQRYAICIETTLLETFTLDSLSSNPLSLPHNVWLHPQLRFPSSFMGMHNHNDFTKKKVKYMGSVQFTLKQLPISLTHLTLPKFFDSSLDDMLPSGLKFLSLGRYFNQPLEHLPLLTHLILGENFSHPITHLPVSLQQLVVKGELYDQQGSLDLTYLTHLTHIHFTSRHHSMCRILPCFPSSLAHISTAPFFWNCALNINANQTPFRIMPDLRFIRGLCTRFSKFLSFTPNLTHLLAKGSFDSSIITQQIPDSVTHLSLDNCWIDSIHHHLPYNLLHLAVTTFQRSSLKIISNMPSLRSLLLQMELEHNRYLDFHPPLPPNLTHFTLLLWRPHTAKIHIASTSLTHFTISSNVESEPSEPSSSSLTLSIDTPHLTHLDVQITTRHLRYVLAQILDPALCPLPSLTHLTVGKRHEIQQTCRVPPKLSFSRFSHLSHLRLQDHAHLRITELPPEVSHLALGRLSLVSKKLPVGKVTHVSVPEDYPANHMKKIRKIFHNVEFTVQEVHQVKFHKQNVYWRYSFD